MGDETGGDGNLFFYFFILNELPSVVEDTDRELLMMMRGVKKISAINKIYK